MKIRFDKIENIKNIFIIVVGLLKGLYGNFAKFDHKLLCILNLITYFMIE